MYCTHRHNHGHIRTHSPVRTSPDRTLAADKCIPRRTTVNGLLEQKKSFKNAKVNPWVLHITSTSSNSSSSSASLSRPNERKSFRILGMSSKLNPSAANKFSTFGIEVVVGAGGVYFSKIRLVYLADRWRAGF